jgi:hypothetical protein
MKKCTSKLWRRKAFEQGKVKFQKKFLVEVKSILAIGEPAKSMGQFHQTLFDQ